MRAALGPRSLPTDGMMRAGYAPHRLYQRKCECCCLSHRIRDQDYSRGGRGGHSEVHSTIFGVRNVK
jgi:hypothetical protein